MAQTIITQNRTIINFEKLLAVFVDPDYDDNENLVGFSLVGVTDMDEKKDSILLGRYPDEESAMKAKDDLISWLATPPFPLEKIEEMTRAMGGDGDLKW